MFSDVGVGLLKTCYSKVIKMFSFESFDSVTYNVFVGLLPGPVLLTWIHFNPKVDTSIIKYGMNLLIHPQI